jgi:hypothetical protein
MSDATNIDQIVHDILSDMPLKEKAVIANLDENKVPYLAGSALIWTSYV